ncbi:MAG: porin family protein, partial [Gemmatimonadetes bacterium]|nr:porin family protein [Gemmatimonadota bacterium]
MPVSFPSSLNLVEFRVSHSLSLTIKKALLTLALCAIASAPANAQRGVAYEAGVFGHFTKFDAVTKLDNGLGIGGHVDVYLLRRLSVQYSLDVASSHSGIDGSDLTVLNNRFDLIYNHPLNTKWRAMLGAGWTGSQFRGDIDKDEYDSGLNGLLGLRYCVNDYWSWFGAALADFKDPSDQAPAFSRTTTWSLRVGLTHFFGGQAKNGPCLDSTPAPLPPPPPPAQTQAPAPPPP